MWLTTLAVIIVLNVFLCFWYWKEKQKYKEIEEKIPGPPTKFFFGNAKEFGDSIIESFNACQRLIKTYGPLVRIWQGPLKLILLVTDVDHVEYFLSSNTHIKKSSGYRLFEAWIGQGLVTSTGEKWKKHRRLLTPAFHLKSLEQFPSVFHNTGQILVGNLKNERGYPVDIYKHIKKYALDVLCETSMRISVGAQEGRATEYLNASYTYLNIYLRRFFSVLRRSDFLFQFFPDYTAHKSSADYLHKFTMDVVQQRKRERLEPGGKVDFGVTKSKAFLDILLDSNELTDEEIREEVDTFLLAGHDTVTSGISFGIFELAKHPDVQEKILEEIHEVVGTDNDEEITLKHFHELKYLDCTAREILRITPPVPFFERELTEDVVLDGMKIPSGTTVSFHPYMQHRNEKFFPDPETFDPDRFLPHNTVNRHPFVFIPFSAGPRNCIGSKYAMLNMKSMIANVIRNFEIRPLVPAHVPILANDAVLISTNGLPVLLYDRK